VILRSLIPLSPLHWFIEAQLYRFRPAVDSILLSLKYGFGFSFNLFLWYGRELVKCEIIPLCEGIIPVVKFPVELVTRVTPGSRWRFLTGTGGSNGIRRVVGESLGFQIRGLAATG
jgi:hypothetical protein